MSKLERLLEFIRPIPDIQKNPLDYVLEQLQTKKEKDSLWLEFGVYKGTSINHISTYTQKTVYGFDSFEGLPHDWRPKYEKGAFSLQGQLPVVNENVRLIKGLFEETLEGFLQEQNKKIEFIHIDSDLYSAAKYILDTCAPYFAENCYIVFDELVNFEYFESDTSELMALFDFLQDHTVEWEWVGMRGPLNLTLTKGIKGYYYSYFQNAAICIKKVFL